MRRIPIEITPCFALFLAFLLCLDPADLCLPFLLAAALHELGHLLCMRLLCVPVHRLQIGLTGAILSTGVMGREQEWKVAVAGPLVNLLCCLLFREQKFTCMNVLLACFNLLPVWPLDGGRILLACCPVCGEQISRIVSILLFCCGCALTAVCHLGLWPLLLLTVLLIKVLMNRLQEEKLIANTGFGRYNI